MGKLLTSGFIVIGILVSSYTVVLQTRWNIQNDNYTIAFETQKVQGKIKGLSGEILFDEKKIQEAKIDVSVDVNTIATGFWLKNIHAKSDKFLDVKKYPKISFKSKDFKKTSSGYLVSGTLQIKDISKDITIPFTFNRKGAQGTFQGTFDIDRVDYNLIKEGIGTILHIKIQLPVQVNPGK